VLRRAAPRVWPLRRHVRDAYVRAIAAGRAAKDLSVEEVWILGEYKSDELPLDVAEALGLDAPRGTYAEAVLVALNTRRDIDRAKSGAA
jgi:hypothetical protein